MASEPDAVAPLRAHSGLDSTELLVYDEHHHLPDGDEGTEETGL